jgi:hypothetical protein
VAALVSTHKIQEGCISMMSEWDVVLYDFRLTGLTSRRLLVNPLSQASCRCVVPQGWGCLRFSSMAMESNSSLRVYTFVHLPEMDWRRNVRLHWSDRMRF